MKKALKFLAIALCIIPCVMLFAACGSVAGNKYNYEKIEISFTNTTDEAKAALLEETGMTESEFLAKFKEEYFVNSGIEKGSMEFTEDGKLITYTDGVAEDFAMYYVQDGNKITVYSDEAHTDLIDYYHFEKDGNRMLMISEQTEKDVTLKIVIHFKKA